MLGTQQDMDWGVPTIAEVLQLVKQDRGLSYNRRTKLRMAVLAMVKHTRLDPTATKASYSACRGAIIRFRPASAGISEKWWRDVQVRTSSAFNRYGGPSSYSKGDPLSPEWQKLRDALSDWQFVRRLTRFMRYCNHLDIAPFEVSDNASEGFFRYLNEGTSSANPKKKHRQTCQDWNRAADAIDGWPQVRLTVPVYHHRFSLPISQFPPSLVADLDAWAAAGASTDPLRPDGPKHPLQPITIRTKLRVLRYFASALVHSGVAVHRITSIASLVEPENFERGIAYLWKRAGSQRSKWLSEVSNELANVARVWVRVDPVRYVMIRRVVTRLTPPREPGITAKNRQILRQLDDPAHVKKLLGLPKLLASIAGKVPRVRAAYLMQMAVAIELLLVAPLRIGSLHCLRLNTHFVFAPRRRRRVGRVDVVIPGTNVKNAMPLAFELPNETVILLDHYVRRHLPRLTPPPVDALFPGATGEPKQSTRLATQIKETVARYTGLTVNVHAFRHIAARLYLERFPQEYFLVGLLLGHRSVLTTMRAYCELGVRPAARQYSEHVLGRHFSTPCRATARLGANRVKELQRARTGWKWI
jgi:integrase